MRLMPFQMQIQLTMPLTLSGVRSVPFLPQRRLRKSRKRILIHYRGTSQRITHDDQCQQQGRTSRKSLRMPPRSGIFKIAFQRLGESPRKYEWIGSVSLFMSSLDRLWQLSDPSTVVSELSAWFVSGSRLVIVFLSKSEDLWPTCCFSCENTDLLIYDAPGSLLVLWIPAEEKRVAACRMRSLELATV